MCSPAQYIMPFLLNHLKYLCPSKFLHLLPMHWLAVLLSQAGASTLQGPSEPTAAIPGFWEAIPALREGRRWERAHLNGLGALGACLALAGRQLISACSGRWQWLQKMVMLPGLGWLELAGNLLRLRLWLNLLTLLLLASFCSLLGCRGQATHGRELPLVTQLQTARGYF